MNHREQVAHHEAAHAVVALVTGVGLSHHGMALDAPTSVLGAFGLTGVKTFAADLDQPEAAQRQDLVFLLAITLAGAISDAKLKGMSPQDALRAQPGDLRVAKRLCAQYPLARGDLEAEAIEVGLLFAARYLEKDCAWDAVRAVAKACLANGGELSKKAIEAIALPILGIEGPVGLTSSLD